MNQAHWCCACEKDGDFDVMRIREGKNHNTLCIDCVRACLLPWKGCGDFRTNVRLTLVGINQTKKLTPFESNE